MDELNGFYGILEPCVVPIVTGVGITEDLTVYLLVPLECGEVKVLPIDALATERFVFSNITERFAEFPTIEVVSWNLVPYRHLDAKRFN